MSRVSSMSNLNSCGLVIKLCFLVNDTFASVGKQEIGQGRDLGNDY